MGLEASLRLAWYSILYICQSNQSEYLKYKLLDSVISKHAPGMRKAVVFVDDYH